jgi:BirA family transcriptional regulator, biotin operon repressor / biotin---[acetyl-CoA-carboxylase] ligase
MAEDITQSQIDILNFLQDQDDTWVSIKALATQFHLTTAKVNASLRELLRWGYRFESNKRGQIRFQLAPDILFPHEIARNLKTATLGREIHAFRSAGSTNTIAQRYAERGAPNGTLIIAGRQTAGRGRLGRKWLSPAKVGIYLSLILRPKIAPAHAPGLSLIAALSVAESLARYPKLPATIKWPNDVLVHGRKVAGVLTELSAEIDRVSYVIVGIGINANQVISDFPAELAGKATSLRIESAAKVDRVKVVQNVLVHFDRRYQQFLRTGLKDQIKSIREHSAILSREITFKSSGKTMTGTAVDIDDDGSLIVNSNKRQIKLSSGEVTLAESY